MGVQVGCHYINRTCMDHDGNRNAEVFGPSMNQEPAISLALLDARQ